MARKYKARDINSTNLAWHTELGENENAANYSEWVWVEGHTEVDGQSKTAYHFTIAWYWAIPNQAGQSGETATDSRWPAIQFILLTPDGKKYGDYKTFSPESFKPDEFGGGTWAHNTFRWRLTPEGMPLGYDINLSIFDIQLNISAKAIATGLQFSDEDHGYSYYHPVKKIALGWWPLVPRSEIEGTLTFQGSVVNIKGLAYCEKQLSNMPLSFGGGAQNMWHWGHLFAGDYTVAWTDSAASKNFRYRHFSPVAVWKGSDLVLGTLQAACCVEKFNIHPVTKSLYPEIESIRAADGDMEFAAQFQPGKIIESHSPLEHKPGQLSLTYVRQICPVDIQVTRGDKVEEARGTAAREWGSGPDWFPYDRLK
jgi:hypothetical protein